MFPTRPIIASMPVDSTGIPISDIWTVFAIISVVIVLFAWDILPVIAVCMAAALAFWETGILTLQQSLGGFGDPAVIFIASLSASVPGLK